MIARKERPILFSAPMVRALLEGSKTQTRRVLKPQPQDHHWKIFPSYDLKQTGPIVMGDGRMGVRFHHTIPHNPNWDSEPWALCPYGQPGDRLWVRESLGYDPEWGHKWADGTYLCEVFGDAYCEDDKMPDRGIPSIHVPRRYSRIDLEVTGVRVERLQHISALDALEEGLNHCTDLPYRWDHPVCMQTAQRLYSELWEQINGAGSWSANPWVWVVSFRRAAS